MNQKRGYLKVGFRKIATEEIEVLSIVRKDSTRGLLFWQLVLRKEDLLRQLIRA